LIILWYSTRERERELLQKILPRDNAGDDVVGVDHEEMTKAESAEEHEDSRDRSQLVDRVGRGIHEDLHVDCVVLRCVVAADMDVLDRGEARVFVAEHLDGHGALPEAFRLFEQRSLENDDELRAEDDAADSAVLAVRLVDLVNDGKAVVRRGSQDFHDVVDVLPHANAHDLLAHDLLRLHVDFLDWRVPCEDRNAAALDLRVVDAFVEVVAHPFGGGEGEDDGKGEPDVACRLDDDDSEGDRHPDGSAELSCSADQSVLAGVDESVGEKELKALDDPGSSEGLMTAL
jgi:hypothetical protein